MLHRQQKGFTIMEIIFVITIVAILAAVAIPRFGTASTDATEVVSTRNVNIVQKQAERYYIHNGEYPDHMGIFINDSQYFASSPIPPEGMEFSIDHKGIVGLVEIPPITPPPPPPPPRPQ